MYEFRATEAEYLDAPDCDRALVADSYRFMETVNRWFGGIRTVRLFLAAEAVRRNSDRPMRILDIGAGSCDIPLAMSRWARLRGIAMHFTCLEMAGHAFSIAKEKVARAADPAVQLVQGDVFTHRPDEPYDCAMASMCFHHFEDSQIVPLLCRLRNCVRTSVLINDLRRTPLASLAVRPLLLLAPAGVRHDALLSIRRGFKIGELRALLQQIDGATVCVTPAWWFRVAAVIRFDTTREEKA